MSFSPNLNAAPGSSFDGDFVKIEHEDYLDDEPSTLVAGGADFGLSSNKKEDDSSHEDSLAMSTAAPGSSLDVPDKKAPEYYIDDEPSTSGIGYSMRPIKDEAPLELEDRGNTVYICYYCRRDWDSFTALKGCVRSCFKRTVNTAPEFGLDGVPVKEEPEYYLDDEPSILGIGCSLRRVQEEAPLGLAVEFLLLKDGDKAAYYCYYCQRDWKSYYALKGCVRSCFDRTMNKSKKYSSATAGNKNPLSCNLKHHCLSRRTNVKAHSCSH